MKPFAKLIANSLRVCVRAYQLLISPLLANACRYHPSCSRYALDALEQHGPVTGSWLALKRLSRCHPWGGYGYDPVPEPGSRVPTQENPHRHSQDVCSVHSEKRTLASK